MDSTGSGSPERERVVYEFDAFRVDPVRRVLSRDGEPVAITPKALSILLVLLERAGEVVEKKTLIDRVWAGTFVSEANLTQNVFALRKSLGERAAETRYIVTVPGQGYSFAAEVRRVEGQATGEIAIVTDPPAPPAAEEGEPPAVAAAPAAQPETARRRFSLGTLAVLLALLAVGGVCAFLLSRADPEPGAKPVPPAGRPAMRRVIAVLDFKSLVPREDAQWLDVAFAEMLRTELAAGGTMRVIRGETVAQAQTSLRLADTPGPAELRQLQEILGCDFIVVGSYLPMREKIRLDLRVFRPSAGEPVESFMETGTQPELFDLIARTGRNLRRVLEISELSPQQIRETRALQPANTEAYRLYSEGLTQLRAFDPPGALRLLQRAAEADPDSPVIHSTLSQAWSVLGYDERAVEAARKAQQLAKPLSREERLSIEGRYHKAAKDWERASQTYLSLWTFHPDDLEYGLELAESLMAGGRGAEAMESLAMLRKLPPPAGEDPRIDLIEARNAWRLADYTTEKLAAERAAAKGRKSGQGLVVAQALVSQGQALEKLGRIREAIRLYRESAALSEKDGYQWGVGRALFNVGRGLQILGDLEGAKAAHEEALAIAERLESAIGMASQLYSLGGLHSDRGELPEALSRLEESRQWCVRMGDRLLEARTLNAMGSVLLAQGDLAAAQRWFERALQLSQSTGGRTEEAVSLDNLGSVLAARGELGEARRRHEKAFELLERAGDPSLAASALIAWADANARLGDSRTAWQQSAQALAAKQRDGDRIGAGRVLGTRAWLAYVMGNLAASRTMAEAQLRIVRETGARSLDGRGLLNLGRVDLAAGNLAAARRSFEGALRASGGLQAMETRLDLAGLALAEDRVGEAASLAREAAAWYRRREMPGGEAEALSLLAEALVRQGFAAEARQAASGARAGLEKSEDRLLRSRVDARLERIAAGIGRISIGSPSPPGSAGPPRRETSRAPRARSGHPR